MENSILYLYLKRVASGDRSYLKRLCQKIADKVVYVPVQDEIDSGDQTGLVKLKVPCVRKPLRKSSVPVFTTPEHFALWCQANGHTTGSVSILCSDLCLALDNGSTVHINPNSDLSVELNNQYKKLIAQAIS
ncbi:MAG: SseB family protein [SAR324 cluster bacterium]|uniref:SseB family protein n=1 Tax=SAR324 cluster bacterium TaxID=2024889 RepID=A0A7X9FTF8_9DELT|nr:SseB family protein [SAR324 cluster bacterium]